jgi:thioredoxin-related protein
MKKIFAALILSLTVATSFGHGKEWLTDFPAAKKQAAAEKKRILMLFTGSDWCPHCIQWEKEVFSKPEFEEYARTNFVLVLVDFPDRKKLPKAQERANDTLKDKYNVGEYPELFVLDAKGKELTRIKYTEGGLAALQQKLDSTKAQ